MKLDGARLLRTANLYLYLGGTVLALFWMMDGLTIYRPPVASSVPVAAPARVERPAQRAFVLMLDSLRYQTAVSADLMPQLAGLRAQAVCAEVKPSYNAITVPCLRAAFTGREEVGVLSFVSNFIYSDAKLESLFTQLAAHGLRSAAFSDGSFRQFGAAIDPSFSVDVSMDDPGVEDYDDATVRRALALFQEGRHALVVVHVNYTDHAAHRYTVHGAGYRASYRRADALVGLLAHALPPDATLVVMGDHGHTPEGQHLPGQDVPTFALYRGPAFKRGVFLGKIDIASHRYLLSQVFGLPLPANGYVGGRYPEALVGGPAARPARAQVVQPAVRLAPVGLWIYLGLLAAFALNLLAAEWSPVGRARILPWAAWLALPAAAAPLPWNAWLGTATGATVAWWAWRGQPWRGWLRWLLAPVAAGIAFHYWGVGLAAARDRVHEVTSTELGLGWLLVGAIAALLANRDNRLRLCAVIGLASGFLFYPTDFRYGFAGIMVPLLWVWLACLLASLAREGRLRAPAALGWTAGLAAAIFALTQAFAGIDAQHFIFSGFVPLVYSLGPENGGVLMWIGLAAKALIFFPARPRSAAATIAKVALIAGLHVLQWRWWVPAPWLAVTLGAGLLAGWLTARRRHAELADACGLGLLFFLYVYCVMPIRETYNWADCLFAALLLSARLVRRFPQPENAAGDYLLLGAVAVLVAGFVSVSWSIEKLEWTRAYAWFDAGTVERYAALFTPWIVLKCLLPLLIARCVLAGELATVARWPGERLRALAGAKLLSLLLVVTGLGVAGAVDYVYLEGAQQATVLLILLLGLAA